jgi:hypothetical protein
MCNIIGCFKKRALEWYSKCYCVASVTKTFTPKGVHSIHRLISWTMDSLYAIKCKCFRNTRHNVAFGIPLQSSFWNTLHYQWKSHWTVTIPGKTWCLYNTSWWLVGVAQVLNYPNPLSHQQHSSTNFYIYKRLYNSNNLISSTVWIIRIPGLSLYSLFGDCFITVTRVRYVVHKPLHVIYKVSKLAYRIWVILIANKKS